MFAHAAAPSQCEAVKTRLVGPSGLRAVSFEPCTRLKFLLAGRGFNTAVILRRHGSGRKRMLTFWLGKPMKKPMSPLLPCGL
jgi:hypothetical protein